MNDRETRAAGDRTRVLVAADGEGRASEHERPVSGDLTTSTRRLLQDARRREGRFSRSTPAEPMS